MELKRLHTVEAWIETRKPEPVQQLRCYFIFHYFIHFRLCIRTTESGLIDCNFANIFLDKSTTVSGHYRKAQTIVVHAQLNGARIYFLKRKCACMMIVTNRRSAQLSSAHRRTSASVSSIAALDGRIASARSADSVPMQMMEWSRAAYRRIAGKHEDSLQQWPPHVCSMQTLPFRGRWYATNQLQQFMCRAVMEVDEGCFGVRGTLGILCLRRFSL